MSDVIRKIHIAQHAEERIHKQRPQQGIISTQRFSSQTLNISLATQRTINKIQSGNVRKVNWPVRLCGRGEIRDMTQFASAPTQPAVYNRNHDVGRTVIKGVGNEITKTINKPNMAEPSEPDSIITTWWFRYWNEINVIIMWHVCVCFARFRKLAQVRIIWVHIKNKNKITWKDGAESLQAAVLEHIRCYMRTQNGMDVAICSSITYFRILTESQEILGSNHQKADWWCMR